MQLGFRFGAEFGSGIERSNTGLVYPLGFGTSYVMFLHLPLLLLPLLLLLLLPLPLLLLLGLILQLLLLLQPLIPER